MGKTRSLNGCDDEGPPPQQYKSETHHGKVVPNKARHHEKRFSHTESDFLLKGPDGIY